MPKDITKNFEILHRLSSNIKNNESSAKVLSELSETPFKTELFLLSDGSIDIDLETAKELLLMMLIDNMYIDSFISLN